MKHTIDNQTRNMLINMPEAEAIDALVSIYGYKKMDAYRLMVSIALEAAKNTLGI